MKGAAGCGSKKGVAGTNGCESRGVARRRRGVSAGCHQDSASSRCIRTSGWEAVGAVGTVGCRDKRGTGAVFETSLSSASGTGIHPGSWRTMQHGHLGEGGSGDGGDGLQPAGQHRVTGRQGRSCVHVPWRHVEGRAGVSAAGSAHLHGQVQRRLHRHEAPGRQWGRRGWRRRVWGRRAWQGARWRRAWRGARGRRAWRGAAAQQASGGPQSVQQRSITIPATRQESQAVPLQWRRCKQGRCAARSDHHAPGRWRQRWWRR